MLAGLDTLFQGGNATTTRNVALASVAILATGALVYTLFGRSSSTGTKLAPAVIKEEEEEANRIMSSMLEKFQSNLLHAADNTKQKMSSVAKPATSTTVSATTKGGNDEDEFTSLIRILKLISKGTTEKTEEFTSTFVDNYGPPVNEMLGMQFQHGLMYASQNVQQEILSEEGMSIQTLEGLIKKYKEAEEVGQVFVELQRESAKVLSKYGIMFQ